ncbi:MAG: divergent polysaccharide deacetylase family protein, partial [Pseudomonadota bacterium]
VDEALNDVLPADGTSDAADETGNASSDGGSFLQPVETFTDRNDEQGGTGTLPVVRRLGDSSAEDETLEIAGVGDAAEDEAAPVAEEDVSDGPALEVFGTEFDPQDGLPLMSIVLVHEGSEPLSLELLEILPPNIAFAINASLPGAAGIAQAYRSVGREVVMIPSLPAGAAPQDIEQALGANFDLVPEAVAVMDVSGSSFQSDRAAVEQVVDVVSASGHGIITFPRGLNPAHQAAQRAGVPTGLIFRNLDGASETQEQILRSLDRAAFRARQDEAVILVGTTGSTMLSALTEWVLGNRAETVSIAPISAALGS